jgi:hypothetical protein
VRLTLRLRLAGRFPVTVLAESLSALGRLSYAGADSETLRILLSAELNATENGP